MLCHAFDLWLARICISSVRHWHPSVPITLVKDLTSGDFETGALEVRWGVDPLILPACQCGRGFAKIELLLRSRRERFLVLDADTVLCGPILRKLEAWSADFVVSRHGVEDPRSDWFTRTFFDVVRVTRMDRDYLFPGYAFNTGVFVGTSGILTRELFDPHLDWGPPVALKSKQTFACADQGLLNYVLVRCASEGLLTLAVDDFMMWGFSEEAPRLNVRQIVSGPGCERVLHYAGQKPASLIEFPGAEILMFFDRLYHLRLNEAGGGNAPWQPSPPCS